MRRRATIVAVAAGALAAGSLSRPAGAQEPTAREASVKAPAAAKAKPGRWEIGGLFGFRFFSDDSAMGRDDDPLPGSELQNASPFGPRLAFRLNHAFSIEGELELMPTSTANDEAGVFAIGYRAHALYHILPEEERFRPFVVLGLGGDAQSSDDDAVIDDGAVFLLHGGIGGKMRLGDTWGARLDARFLLGPAFDGQFTASHGEVLFSLYFGLGGKGAARADASATASGRGAGGVGGGIDDDDGDGVADDDDECPSQMEDLDGNADDDGCPEREEDVDGDEDGVLGSLDRCPKEQENVNGYQDDDGCRDQPPAAVAEFTGTVEGIAFKSGSATIAKGSYELLDRVAKVLGDNPKLRVVILGHTDNRGRRERNLALSLRRAEAVKRYLVKKGVAEDRLEAIGKGPDDPLDDNASREGRARNRRIEFQMVGGAGTGEK